MMLRTKARVNLCSSCPIARVADLVGDSTVLLIVRDLLKGPRRFGELAASLVGVSSRTLSKKLRYLLEVGLIDHGKDTLVYRLTNKGRGLSTIERAMRSYGERYLG